jgi:TolB-like protein
MAVPGVEIDTSNVVAPTEPAICLQLARILQSSIFAQSERMNRFLRFIVEQTLGGNQGYLKEYVIGSEVYERKPPYHPSQDSIVRTEARRLRGKLKEYYEKEGKDDPIYIYLRPGRYVPVFHYKTTVVSVQQAKYDIRPLLAAKSEQIAIAILPFRDLSNSPLSLAYARAIPDELAFILMRAETWRVISPVAMAHLSTHEQDMAIAMEKAGAHLAFEGSVREEGNQIRVTARIIDASGFQLWVKRLDAEALPNSAFNNQEEIAGALCTGLENLLDVLQTANTR